MPACAPAIMVGGVSHVRALSRPERRGACGQTPYGTGACTSVRAGRGADALPPHSTERRRAPCVVVVLVVALVMLGADARAARRQRGPRENARLWRESAPTAAQGDPASGVCVSLGVGAAMERPSAPAVVSAPRSRATARSTLRNLPRADSKARTRTEHQRGTTPSDTGDTPRHQRQRTLKTIRPSHHYEQQHDQQQQQGNHYEEHHQPYEQQPSRATITGPIDFHRLAPRVRWLPAPGSRRGRQAGSGSGCSHAGAWVKGIVGPPRACD